MSTDTTTDRRTPLSRERVLQAAVDLADRHGIAALTMRNLAGELGVEAMSLYHHVANKEDLLTGVVDTIATELCEAVDRLDGPDPGVDWKLAMRRRILTAREVMLRHRWAPSVIETRTQASPAILRYFDGLLGIMVAGGFSYDLAHHAMHALGSRALGFTQELFEPDEQNPDDELSMAQLEAMAEEIPNLVTMVSQVSHDEPDVTLGWCDDQTEFEFGLDLLLDGLERLNRSEA